MLVSHRLRFIYLKTRKTAGSSVFNYFEPYCTPEGEPPPLLTASRPALVGTAGIIGYHRPDPQVTTWWNHMPAALVRSRLGSAWDDYTKFCCIRDPFDKVFSYFWFNHREYGGLDLSALEISSLFREWVLSDNDLARDREMYALGDQGPPGLDFYLRYENLHFDLGTLCSRLGFQFKPENLARLKGDARPRHLAHAPFYDRASADRVREVYEQEFDWFGYSRELSGPTSASPGRA